MTRRESLLRLWVEQAAIEYYVRQDEAEAERIMRQALAVVR